MGIAQKENAALLGLSFKIVKIDVPVSVLLHQLVFHYGTVPGLHHIVEFRVNRRLNHDLVSVFTEQLHNRRQGRNHAQAPAHQGNVRLPVVPFYLPLLNSLKVTVRPRGISPDSLLGFLDTGVDDGLSGAEIHIRYPQRNHIGSSELLHPLVIFGGTVLAAVDHFIKIVFHTGILPSVVSCSALLFSIFYAKLYHILQKILIFSFLSCEKHKKPPESALFPMVFFIAHLFFNFFILCRLIFFECLRVNFAFLFGYFQQTPVLTRFCGELCPDSLFTLPVPVFFQSSLGEPEFLSP